MQPIRAAIAPFLAAKLFKGTFKWILYGDDDTLWVVDNLLRYLGTLDHTMPYMLSDALWFLNRGPPGALCACGHYDNVHHQLPVVTAFATPSSQTANSITATRRPAACPATTPTR